MFERYNERARRSIFFARYEASQFGSPSIETEHILIGLLREDKALTNRLLPSHTAVEQIRKEIERATVPREQISTSVDLPLSNECRRVLAYANEESGRFGHKIIGTEHLLLGLLREERGLAAQLLNSVGVTLTLAREDLQKHGAPAPHPTSPTAPDTIYPINTVKVSSLAASARFYRNLGLRALETSPPSKLLILGEPPFVIVLFDQSLGPTLLCLAVSDLHQSLSQLQQSGTHLEEPLTAHGTRTQSALIRDPDGNLVCLLSIM